MPQSVGWAMPTVSNPLWWAMPTLQFLNPLIIKGREAAYRGPEVISNPSLRVCVVFFFSCVFLLTGCGTSSYQGEILKTSSKVEKVNYEEAKVGWNPDYQNPDAIVIGVPEIQIDHPEGEEDEPHQIAMPPSLKVRQPFAIEGVLKANPRLVEETVILMEMIQVRPDGTEVVTQTSTKVIDTPKGTMPFRIDFPLPRRPGKHHLRIGAL
ncbi:MAG: hypothetical protein FJ267_07920, partial [Planctomycetes bacterium]|nr:hypothetical protein [Planctomycetota bacterium]